MSHWQKYDQKWPAIEAPLRPDKEVVGAFQKLLGPYQEKILLLGVTPELANAFPRVEAIDINPNMIANVWPGDTSTKKAHLGNWLTCEMEPGSFSGVLGDGSINNVVHPGEYGVLFRNILAALRPGGRVACRLFERPTTPFTFDKLVRLANAPAKINFHAFKFMVAMQVAEEMGASIRVTKIRNAFQTFFPDRDRLSAITGWPRAVIDTIDIYEGSETVYSFPNRREFEEALPQGISDVEFLAVGSYDLAECCPILTFRKR